MCRRHTRYLKAAAILFLFAVCLKPCVSMAAVGCALANPLQDLNYIYPQMTSYKEETRDFSQMKDGRRLYRSLNERLGSDLDPLYEGFGTPYTIYMIYKGKELIGVVHGVNVPGENGLIQVILSMDPKTATIRRIFFQRMESRASRDLRKKEFLDQFVALTLVDFYQHDYYKVVAPGSAKDRIVKIKNPVAGRSGANDFDAIIRGIRKNLILLDIFIYNRKFESYYQEMRSKLARVTNREKRPK